MCLLHLPTEKAVTAKGGKGWRKRQGETFSGLHETASAVREFCVEVLVGTGTSEFRGSQSLMSDVYC